MVKGNKKKKIISKFQKIRPSFIPHYQIFKNLHPDDMVTKSVFDICNIVVIGEFEWEKTKVKNCMNLHVLIKVKRL